MASLYIKDPETADLATRIARRMGTTKTEAVRNALKRVEAELADPDPKPDFVEWVKQYRRDNPLPPPSGRKADKAFYDWLSGEEDIDDFVP